MKVLLLTANFAPRGASPAIRPTYVSAEMICRGLKVEVITYSEDALQLFSPADSHLAAKVPPELALRRIPPGPLRRLLMRLSRSKPAAPSAVKKRISSLSLAALAWPDPHFEAIPSFVREAVRSMREDAADVVMTVGYPFSMHLVGLYLKKRFPRVVWFSDYGDPWSGSPVSELPRPIWRKWLDQRFESWMLRRCDAVVVTTAKTKELYASLFPHCADRLHVIPMGYDPDQFRRVAALVRPADAVGRVWLVHTGRVYGKARNPLPLIEAVEALARGAPDLAERLQIVLVGELEQHYAERIESSTAAQSFRVIPWVTSDESIAWMKAADSLLLFGNRGGVQIPGKVYQYLGAGDKPIVLLQDDKDDPVIDILREHPGAQIIHNEPGPILEALKALLRREAQRPPSAPQEVNRAARFSWPYLGGLYTDLVRRVAGSR
jgi:glycosyltransferase involved in cell wall biosynthesis